MAGFDFESNGGRAQLFEVLVEALDDLCRFLIGNEARGDLGARPCGNDRFAAFALVAAGEAVDFQSRSRGAALRGGVGFFTKQRRDTKEFSERRIIVREAGKLPALVG